MAYTYQEDFSTPLCPLRIIATTAKDIKLVNLHEDGGVKKLRDTSYYGVNGCFFDAGEADKKLLNIVAQNGSIIGPGVSGESNDVGTGAIAFSGTNIFTLTNARTYTDVKRFSSGTGSWAQGGIAMWLSSEAWETEVENQGLGASSYLDGSDRRTAMIVEKSTKKVYLVMTNGGVTFKAFRAAIQKWLGITDSASLHGGYFGLMLDGGRSSQMRVMQGTTLRNFPIDDLPFEITNRTLAQIITVE